MRRFVAQIDCCALIVYGMIKTTGRMMGAIPSKPDWETKASIRRDSIEVDGWWYIHLEVNRHGRACRSLVDAWFPTSFLDPSGIRRESCQSRFSRRQIQETSTVAQRVSSSLAIDHADYLEINHHRFNRNPMTIPFYKTYLDDQNTEMIDRRDRCW